jgi:hypothetical protein
VQALREAEVEFYTWDSRVPGPFLQVVTDLCRGGAVFWCEDVKEPAQAQPGAAQTQSGAAPTQPGAACSGNIIIRCQILGSMCQVYEFVTKAILSLPEYVVKAQQWPAVSRLQS